MRGMWTKDPQILGHSKGTLVSLKVYKLFDAIIIKEGGEGEKLS
jgi:hypothetical protein